MSTPKPAVALRERSSGEVIDLACKILRRHWLPIVAVSIPVVIPVVAALYGILLSINFGNSATELGGFMLMGVVARDLVTLPVISLTGSIVFSEKPSIREAWARLRESIGPLLIHWFVCRFLAPMATFLIIVQLGSADDGPLLGVIAGTIVFFFLDNRRWYAPEVFMLERLRGGKAKKRLKYISKSPQSNQVSEAMILFTVSWVNVMIVTMAGITALGLFGPDLIGEDIASMGFSPLTSPMPWMAMVVTWMWQGIAHCLFYLNQRTIAEGWEVETDLRLAAMALRQKGVL